MNNISAILAIKDNPPHVFESIDSISEFVNEILIADIGMDESVKSKLLKNKKVRFVTSFKNVAYIELIREELKNMAKNEYILYIDPDEIFPGELLKQIKDGLDTYDFFQIPRKNIIFGKWIVNSRWWPDYQVRVFKKNSVVWPHKLHQQPELSGNGVIIEPDEKYAIIHHNYENIDEYMFKSVRYAKSEASETLRDQKILTLQETIQKALSEFFSRYYSNGGYKDGMHGFVLAMLQMFYYFLVYFYYWELRKYEEVSNKEIHTNIRFFFKQGLYETNHWLIVKKLLSSGRTFLLRIENKLLKK